jgi:hypothetical protein
MSSVGGLGVALFGIVSIGLLLLWLCIGKLTGKFN